MTAAAVVTSRFEMGRVVSRTFGVIGRNFVVFALLSLIVAGIPAALTNYFSESRTAGGRLRRAAGRSDRGVHQPAGLVRAAGGAHSWDHLGP